MQALFVMATTRIHPASKKIAAIFCGKKKMKPVHITAKTVSGSKCPNYGTGRELWAFIPASQVPRLKNNLLSAGDRAQINTPPALSDVYIDTDGDGLADSWRTIVIGASGNGGDSIFCLDVTDPNRPTFLWEFSAIDLFRDPNAQAVAQIGRILGPFDRRTQVDGVYCHRKNGGKR